MNVNMQEGMNMNLNVMTHIKTWNTSMDMDTDMNKHEKCIMPSLTAFS